MKSYATWILAASTAALLGCRDESGIPSNVALGTPRPLVYVTDDGSVEKHGGAGSGGTVHVFELDTLAHVGAFAVGSSASEIHATPDGANVWILASASNQVAWLDTTSWELRAIPVGVSPVHSYLAPGGNEVWVGNDGSADVSILSVASRSVVATVLTGAGHHKMALAYDELGSFVRAYVSNITDGTITPVTPDHVATPNVAGVGPAPHGMDFSGLTQRVYNCSGDASSNVEVIATRDEIGTATDDTNTIVARIALPARCSYLHVSADGAYAYASIPSADTFVRIDLADHAITTYGAGDSPDKFAIVDHRAFVGNVLEPTMSVIDLDQVEPTVTVPVGDAVAAGATRGHRALRYHDGRVYVVNAFSGTVSVVDTTTLAVVATLDGMHAPSGIAIAGPAGGTTYPRE